MKTDLFYQTALGRAGLKALQKTGAFGLAARFLRTKASRLLIPGFMKRHGIDMRGYEERKFQSFADFFAREAPAFQCNCNPQTLVSPCEGFLSVYEITTIQTIPIKGFDYSLAELIPDKEVAAAFQDGLCLVFRLTAADNHHFICFDDGLLIDTEYIPGELHSVQPAALASRPVLCRNRRWWSLLETANFGSVVQIEVGAVLVGGVSFSVWNDWFLRGDEMGCFELAGSTIALLLTADIRNRLVLCDRVQNALEGRQEQRVRMGMTIGKLKDKSECGYSAADRCENSSFRV